MSAAREHLRRWLNAGLIDASAAERIQAFEAQEAQATSGERPTAVEALVYLGLAVGAVGTIVLVVANWERLAAWAHVATPALPGALALAAGQALRSAAAPELRRGGQVAWAVAVALAGLTVVAIGIEADWAEGDTAIVSSLVAAAMAIGLWTLEPSHPQIVALQAALVSLGLSMGSLPQRDEFSVPAAGMSIALFAAASLASVELGALRPRATGRVLGAIALAVGVLFLNTDEQERLWAESLSLLAGAGLIGLGIRQATFIYVGVGVATIFVGLIVLVVRRLEDPTLAALALMVLGALLVGAVMLLSKTRPWQRTPA